MYLGDIVDSATSAASSVIPGASLLLPDDQPWYTKWWGMGLIGLGGVAVIAWALWPPKRPTYVVVERPQR